MSRDKWEQRFLDLAAAIAQWSKDPSTKVGCVVVGPDREVRATGYNGLPRGVNDEPSRMERPAKYLWTVHAEANAVAHAARTGTSLLGCTAYVTHEPCAQCAALLINAGVAGIVTAGGGTHMSGQTFDVSRTMLLEAGVLMP